MLELGVVWHFLKFVAHNLLAKRDQVLCFSPAHFMRLHFDLELPDDAAKVLLVLYFVVPPEASIHEELQQIEE